MPTLNPKENLLRVLHGQMPEYVPQYSYYGPLPGVEGPPPNMGIGLAPMRGEVREDGSFTDLWGVPFTSVEEVGGFSLPTPDEFILEDITRWQDYIKVPERMKDVDWKAAAEESMKNLAYGRDTTSLWYGPSGGTFLQLMNLMGFSEGLSALYEEPDAVKELLQFFFDFYYPIAEQVFDIIQPDVMNLSDDAATEKNPFISPLMYREFFVPIYREYAKFAIDRGIPINMHLCGRGEDFIPDLVRIGVCSWEPVQLENDILEVKARFGRQMVIGGGWEGRGRLTELDVTDEEIRQSVRDAFDKYAVGGAYMFAAAYTPRKRDDELTTHWNTVLQKEAWDYGQNFYK
ncbi:MAG: veratrol--corrinoid protein metyltransferase [Coriobacteriia bacterium]|nr:veratrol--corrinoid protein metyltransferase [Coriobacteriia bacterium]